MTIAEILKAFYCSLKVVSRDNISKYLKNRFQEEYSELLKLTEKLDRYDVKKTKNTKISIFERIFCIEHGLDDRPMCANCGKEHVCGFDKQKNAYRKWCSAKCQASDRSCAEKSRNTRLEKYGDPNYVGVEKAKATRSERYGGWHSRDFADRLKSTKLEKYGDENFVNAGKARITKLEKYGDENFVNVEKRRRTNLDLHGDPNYSNREKFKTTVSGFSDKRKSEIKNRRRETCMSEYGTDFPTQNESVKQKIQSTCLEKYGVSTPLQTESARKKSLEKIRSASWDLIMSDKGYTPLFTRDEYIGNAESGKLWRWKCNACGHEFSAPYDNGMHHRCYKCYPNNSAGYSMMEKQFCDFIRSATDRPVFNRESENRHSVKGCSEIDVLVPDLGIGFEFDGLYYHSSAAGKAKNYHLNKTDACVKAGIRLVHVFEDEWLFRRRIVETRVKRMLGRVRYRIFARKCETREIPVDIKNRFLDKYHLQGKDSAGLSYGLFYKGRLAAVMTFCKARFGKKCEWELSRYATVSNFEVVGGAGKLLARFERDMKPSSLVTYADRRWSVGNLYFKLGFEHDHDSPPNYFYVKNQRRYSRMAFQKHMLREKLQKYDPAKSERANMSDNGYDVIYDCGNMVFVKKYNYQSK